MKTTKPLRAVNQPDLVSIITPSFNSADYLADAIDSVIRQSYPDWELLIVDDKSVDNSVDIAESYAEKDPRIKVISLAEHCGAAIARNAGIHEAKGRYIGFLDSDDFFHSEKLACQLKFMCENGHVLTHTHYQMVDGRTGRLGDTIRAPGILTYKDMLKANRIGCLTAIYDSAQVGKVFMPIIEKRQDYGLWLRILKGGRLAYCLPQALSYKRLTPGSISRNKVNLLKYNWRLLREIEGLDPLVSAYYLSWQVANRLTKAVPAWLTLGGPMGRN